MFHIVYICEDMNIVADILDGQKARVTVTEGLHGKHATVECTTEELGAAMALNIGGDEQASSEVLYPIAERLMEKLYAVVGDHILRIIP